MTLAAGLFNIQKKKKSHLHEQECIFGEYISWAKTKTKRAARSGVYEHEPEIINRGTLGSVPVSPEPATDSNHQAAAPGEEGADVTGLCVSVRV